MTKNQLRYKIRSKVKESQTIDLRLEGDEMANLSDIIEQFIIGALAQADSIEIGRNELANHFSVAPSQINYVLSTRFTMDRGYVITSRRGGGGYIVVAKIDDDCLDYINELLKDKDELSFRQAESIVVRLLNEALIDESMATIIKAAVSEKALNNPFNMANKIRANILKEIILQLMMKENIINNQNKDN